MSLRFDGRTVLLTGALAGTPGLAELLTARGATVLERFEGAPDAQIHVLPGAAPSEGTVDFGSLESQASALAELFVSLCGPWGEMLSRGYGRVVLVWPAGGPAGDPLGRLAADPSAVVGLGAAGLANCLKLETGPADLRVNVVVPMGAPTEAPPAGLAEVVAFFSHPDCQLQGTIVTVAPEGLRRLFVGVTPGAFSSSISTAWVAEQAPGLVGSTDFVLPDQGGGEMPLLTRHFG